MAGGGIGASPGKDRRPADGARRFPDVPRVFFVGAFGAGALFCLFSARLYKWIWFSRLFTSAELWFIGLRRSLASESCHDSARVGTYK